MHTDPTNPCIVGEHVTVGHCAMLHGCTVGNNSLIGIGATLMNGSCIGSNSIVGAHSLITEGKQYPDGVLIMGTPAKVVRPLRAEEIEAVRANGTRYIERAQRYLQELRALDQD